jgi:hypothetical protein
MKCVMSRVNQFLFPKTFPIVSGLYSPLTPCLTIVYMAKCLKRCQWRELYMGTIYHSAYLRTSSFHFWVGRQWWNLDIEYLDQYRQSWNSIDYSWFIYSKDLYSYSFIWQNSFGCTHNLPFFSENHPWFLIDFWVILLWDCYQVIATIFTDR